MTYSADVVVLDGSDTNACGEGCAPGQGYRQVTKHSYFRADRFDAAAGVSRGGWLAATLRERLGRVEAWNGGETFYAAAERDDGPGRTAMVSACAKGFTDDELVEAAESLGGIEGVVA